MVAGIGEVGAAPAPIEFGEELEAPIVFAQVTSENMESNPMVIRLDKMSSTSFDVKF